jgi:hypothetical protein
MAIGRDVYLDSRAIIQRLEELFPASEQHPGFSTPETAGLAALLNKFTVDASLFVNVCSVAITELSSRVLLIRPNTHQTGYYHYTA